MSHSTPSRKRLSRNGLLAVVCVVFIAGMVGAAYAAVPLYRVFCQVTGYGGTVRKAEVKPGQVLDQTLQIRFDTNVRDLPWDFKAEQVDQTVKIGETAVATFKVTNHSDKPVTARAVFNVVPEQAAVYFRKLSCFCFSDQTVAAGATVEMPVLYFVDPAMLNDPNMKGVEQITLSYTFHRAEAPQDAAPRSTN